MDLLHCKVRQIMNCKSASMGDNVVVLPLPNFGKGAVCPNGARVWTISRTSAAPEVAGRFISFLLKDEGYREVARNNSTFPAPMRRRS